MVTFPWPRRTLTRFSRSRLFWSRMSQKRCVLQTKLLQHTNRKPHHITYNISNGTMFGDLNWPLNASRGFVSISWVFCYPRDATRKRGLCCRHVSGCLSVTRRYCVWTAKLLLKLFRPSSSHQSSFWPRACVPNSNGNPFSGALNTRGVGKLAIFNRISVFSETVRDRLMVAI